MQQSIVLHLGTTDYFSDYLYRLFSGIESHDVFLFLLQELPNYCVQLTPVLLRSNRIIDMSNFGVTMAGIHVDLRGPDPWLARDASLSCLYSGTMVLLVELQYSIAHTST